MMRLFSDCALAGISFKPLFKMLVVMAVGLLVLAQCGEPGTDPAFVSTSGSAQAMVINHSKGLTIAKVADGYLVEVRNPQDTSIVLGKYHFSRKGKSSIGEEVTVVRIPVGNVALNSTTFVPYFDKLAAVNTIGGVSYAARVTNQRAKERFDSGELLEISGGDGLDLERLLMVNPDAVMVYQYGESNYSKVEELGLPVVFNMEYMESTPLGRAEWIKLIGCLLDRYDDAENAFSTVETAYGQIAERAASTGRSPLVFSGSKYDKKWFAPGNKSFAAQFIRDAGGRYAFEHIEGQATAELDFESVLATIQHADYWGLIVSSPVDFTLSGLLKIAPEYALFEAFKQGQVFVCNTARSDYFGDAVMEPHVVLADLVSILHPNALPAHTHTYFHPVVVDVKS